MRCLSATHLTSARCTRTAIARCQGCDVMSHFIYACRHGGIRKRVKQVGKLVVSLGALQCP